MSEQDVQTAVAYYNMFFPDKKIDNIDDFINDFTDSLGNLKVDESNIDEFEKRMKEIQDASYEIVVTVKADFSEDFEELSALLDTYHAGAQLIQKDFAMEIDMNKIKEASKRSIPTVSHKTTSITATMECIVSKVENTVFPSPFPSPKEYAMNREAAPDKEEFMKAKSETNPPTRLYIP